MLRASKCTCSSNFGCHLHLIKLFWGLLLNVQCSPLKRPWVKRPCHLIGQFHKYQLAIIYQIYLYNSQTRVNGQYVAGQMLAV